MRIGVIAAVMAVFIGAAAVAGTFAQATPPPSAATPAATPAAEGTLPYGIQPAESGFSYFEFEANPGDVVELPVQIYNVSDEPIEIRTYKADAYTLVNGGFDSRLDGEPVEETATWIEYEPEQIILEAGQTIERVPVVTVPDNAEPGEYFAALVVQNANPIQTGTIEQVIRQQIAVVVHVPGPEELAIEVGEASFRQLPGYFSLLVGVSNPGNIRVRPSGELAVYDAEDELMLTAPVMMDLVLPGDTTSVEIPLPEQLPLGEYVVELLLGDEASGLTADYFYRDLTVTELPTPTPSPTPDTGPTIFFGTPAPDAAATPAAATPTAAALSPEAAQPPVSGLQPGAAATVNDDVALRDAPDPEATAVLDLPRGTTVLVIGPSQEGAGFTWWPVSEPTTGTTGFIRQEFMTPAP